MKGYYYKLEHNGDGMFEYDKQTFIEEQPYLQISLPLLNKKI